MKNYKITFLGDIMCEEPLLRASKKGSQYSFETVFDEISPFLNNSDYVIGNLETVCAGEKAGYTESLYSFNTPDSFLDALKKAGIDLFLTANNHCMDRGLEGLFRTLDELDKREMEHIGTYKSPNDRNQLFIKEIGGLKIGYLSYTYGTGIKDNKNSIPGEYSYCVNTLMPERIGSPIPYKTSNKSDLLTTFKRKISSKVDEKSKLKLKKVLKRPVGTPRFDVLTQELENPEFLNDLKHDILQIKGHCDFLILNLHNGGQFNSKPGSYAQFVSEFAVEQGVDLIVGHHPHVIQPYDNIQNTPVVYSLGNFLISLSTPYMLFEDLPEYSIALHCYVSNKTYRLTYSILKILEDKNKNLKVYETSELYLKLKSNEKADLLGDLNKITEHFSGKKQSILEPVPEYEIGLFKIKNKDENH